MTLSVAQTADPGAPQAGITISGLSATVACTVVVTVSWDGGTTWHSVLGGTGTNLLGSWFVRDYSVPLNVTATYQAVVTGGTTATWTGTCLITSPVAWMQDPLDPRSAISFDSAPYAGSLLLLHGSLASQMRAQPTFNVVPEGATLPVGSIKARQAPANVPLILGAAQTQNTAYLAALDLLDSAGPVVLRGLPLTVPFDPVMTVSVGDVTPSAPYGILGVFNQLSLNFTQQRPVSTRIVIPWWTYDQVTALVVSQMGGAPTYAGVAAAQPAGKTYTQWTANPGVAS